MEKAKVSSKGQLVIPKQFRDEMGIGKGKEVFVEEIDGVLLIIPIPKDPVKALRGISKGVFKKSSVKLVRELREEWQ